MSNFRLLLGLDPYSLVRKKYEKRDVRGLKKALGNSDPTVRREAIWRLRLLVWSEDDLRQYEAISRDTARWVKDTMARHKIPENTINWAILSPEEIVKHDLLVAVMPSVDDEKEEVQKEANKFFGDVLKRLSGIPQTDVGDYLARIAKQSKPEDSVNVRRVRLDCAVKSELAYDRIRRGSCAVCGLKWDRSVLDTIFTPYVLVGGLVKAGSTQPAGRCPTCGNYYCAKCAIIKTPSVLCPRCNDPLSYRIEDEDDIRQRLKNKFDIGC